MKKISLLTLILGACLLFSGAYCSKKSSTSTTPVSTNQVSMSSFAFNPDNITVTPGTQVTWTNNDSVTHTVVSNDNAFNSSINPGESFNFTFKDAGTFSYHCSIHTNMTGQVVVK